MSIPTRVNSQSQFKSEDFIALSQSNSLDTFTIIEAMTRNPKSGLNDYLVNELYKDDENVEFWIPQLATMVLADPDRISLARFLLDKCASMQFALKLSFWLTAAVEDSTHNKIVSNDFASQTEMAAINCKSRSTITFSKKEAFYRENTEGDSANSGPSTPNSQFITSITAVDPQNTIPQEVPDLTSPSVRRPYQNRLEVLKQRARIAPQSLSRSWEESTHNNTPSTQFGQIAQNFNELIIAANPTESPAFEPKRMDVNQHALPDHSHQSTQNSKLENGTNENQTQNSDQKEENNPNKQEIKKDEKKQETKKDENKKYEKKQETKKNENKKYENKKYENKQETKKDENKNENKKDENNKDEIKKDENKDENNKDEKTDNIDKNHKISNDKLHRQNNNTENHQPQQDNHTHHGDNNNDNQKEVSVLEFIQQKNQNSDSESNNNSNNNNPRRKFETLSSLDVDLFDLDGILDVDKFKHARSHIFQLEMEFIRSMTQVSMILKQQYLSKTKAEKNKALVNCLRQIQQQLVQNNTVDLPVAPTKVHSERKGLFLPLMKSEVFLRVLRILPDESFTLNSKDKVPYMVFIECLEIKRPLRHAVKPRTRKKRIIHDPEMLSGSEHGLLKALFESITIARSRTLNSKDKRVSISSSSEGATDDIAEKDWVMMEEENLLARVYPELWAEKVARLKKLSPWCAHENWTLKAMITKAGDDLRQEQMAMQVISTFHSIFQEAELPLWLYPYAIVASSADSGFIEVVRDAISLDILKQRLPANTSLSDYFKKAYGPPQSMRYIQAVRNFVESLAGYSLVCYFLQIKDRHNGNILIDKEGHLIHIDYGFILTSSPGSISWETAPFKLTQEYIDLLGGENSDMFAYFRLLLLRGFLELRMHSAEILLLVELLIPGNKMGAFTRGPETTLKEMAERFHPELSDQEVVPFISGLIKESANSSRTTQYDLYQYYRNGILV